MIVLALCIWQFLKNLNQIIIQYEMTPNILNKFSFSFIVVKYM